MLVFRVCRCLVDLACVELILCLCIGSDALVFCFVFVY